MISAKCQLGLPRGYKRERLSLTHAWPEICATELLDKYTAGQAEIAGIVMDLSGSRAPEGHLTLETGSASAVFAGGYETMRYFYSGGPSVASYASFLANALAWGSPFSKSLFEHHVLSESWAQ